jgi:membrane associated rhomboid family serine protease
MIGPSPYVQINMGGRFVACMRNVKGVQDSPAPIRFPCPNATTSENQCQLSDLCGFKPVPNPRPGGSIDDKPEPNQWFRFIVPIFLHAGLVHIIFNMLAQLTIGSDMERQIGWWRFVIVYFASGIFGFVLGANFAAPRIVSTGASGSLFGIFALTVLDLLYSWKKRQSPGGELVVLLVAVALSFFLGLLPGLDNFSHIGGFLTGLVLGICILRSPDTLRERIGIKSPYAPMSGGAGPGSDGSKAFIKQPVGFFKGRKPLWWGWWLLRAGALVGIIVAFILLLNNFYKYRTTCSWCKYLTCLVSRDTLLPSFTVVKSKLNQRY